jgi:hypothetical protein
MILRFSLVLDSWRNIHELIIRKNLPEIAELLDGNDVQLGSDPVVRSSDF